MKPLLIPKGILLLLYILFANNITAKPLVEKDEEPQSIGLTLSGGGARGLSHIGILHIIDSLGVKIDYITGTSMGAIVGGMYASGYSADEIEEMALNIDWDIILSFNVNLRYSHPRARETRGKHMITLPLQNGRIALSTGAIEGQQLWNLLSDVFFPVRTISDFSKLSIPFACVATDVETGDAIVMKYGDIVTAIRASMAFPTIFTAVEREKKKLIDGGVVNNFPVDVNKAMGADYAIGVYVSQGLREVEELNSPLDILIQMGYYKDAENYDKNMKEVDVYIEPDLEGYSSGNFNDVAELIELGKKTGRLFIEDFKKIAEEQNKDFDPVKDKNTPDFDNFIIDSVELSGLKNVRKWFVVNTVKIQEGDTITADDITKIVNQLYASGYFDRITYKMIRDADTNRGTLVFVFKENPFANLYSSLHYNKFSGVGIIGEIATRKFLFYNTSAYAKFLLGEKPGIKGGIDYFITDSHLAWISLETKAKYTSFPIIENFNYSAEYNQFFWDNQMIINVMSGSNSYFSAGVGYYMQSLTPSKYRYDHFTGNLSTFKAIGKWKHNSLDKHSFSRFGQLISINAEYFFEQKSSLMYLNQSGEVINNIDEAGININNFLQASILWESNILLNQKLTTYTRLQGGYNFMYNQDFLYMFNMGGTSHFLENQITFAGLEEYGISSNSIIAGELGIRYNVWDDFYLTPIINAALFDFEFQEITLLSTDNLVIGGGLDIGYDSAIGPINITVAYSPQTGKVLPYLNLGWSF
ncbi:MAG: patatin-like phospholipase family protein [Bacteroidota bacterium]